MKKAAALVVCAAFVFGVLPAYGSDTANAYITEYIALHKSVIKTFQDFTGEFKRVKGQKALLALNDKVQAFAVEFSDKSNALEEKYAGVDPETADANLILEFERVSEELGIAASEMVEAFMDASNRNS